MNAGVFFIHARNQMRTVWLMTSYRFSSPYDIQTRNPGLTMSLLAVLAGFVLFASHDYLYYPQDLLAGYVDQGTSRATYLLAYSFGYIAGLALTYLAYFLLAVPMAFAARYWYGLIALNWWTLMVAFGLYPLLLFMLLLEEDDPFLSPALALLLAVFVVVVWKSLNIARHAFRISVAKAVVLVLVGIMVQAGVLYLVVTSAGIRIL